jgi:hypothetical protein
MRFRPSYAPGPPNSAGIRVRAAEHQPSVANRFGSPAAGNLAVTDCLILEDRVRSVVGNVGLFDARLVLKSFVEGYRAVMPQRDPRETPDAQQRAPQGSGYRRFSVKKLVICLLLVAAIGAAIVGYVMYVQFGEMIQDCYAQWRMADMLIDYMERSGGAWPRNWEDLREPYETCSGRSGRHWSFDELQKRIGVRFDANLAQLAKASNSGDKPPFQVVYLRNGEQHYWSGHEPNSMILQYLVERAARPATYKYPKRPVPEEEESRKELTNLGAGWELGSDGHVMAVQLSSMPGSPRYSDAAMSHLTALKGLRELDLGYSNITDAGLASIENATELRSLYLYGTKVTDNGLRHLHRLNKLESLVLASANFSDAGLQYVAGLVSLKLLNLNGARVTDAGLVHLYGLKNLGEVMVGDTKVTNSGAQRLREARPSVRIYPFSDRRSSAASNE